MLAALFLLACGVAGNPTDISTGKEVEEQLRQQLLERDERISDLEETVKALKSTSSREVALRENHEENGTTVEARLAALETLVHNAGVQEMKQELAVMHEVMFDGQDTGTTAWLLVCSALVLLMTIPGLALFYGGLVRVQNVLSTVMQSFSIACLITVMWSAFGYSLAFSTGSPIFGDGNKFWLRNISMHHPHPLNPKIPEPLFVIYELMFAIITPALISGAFADRMRFGSMLLFMAVWHLVVYCPITHSMWMTDGFLFKAGILDFAGGNVVHIAAGCSGLMSSLVVGQRAGFGAENFQPHNILVSVLGASLLWVGWLGFNGGSAGADLKLGSVAVLNTQVAAATASMTWMITEWIIRKRPSVLGIISGSIAGLVTITPGAGFVDLTGAFVSGFLAGPFCYFSAQMKHRFGYDDALDAFGIHAPGGVLGGILTGLLATGDASNGVKGVFYGGGWKILGLQIYGIVVSILWSCVMTYLLLKAIEMLIGLRVNMEEENGLDMLCHGESIMPFPSNMSGLHYSDDEKLTGDRNSRRASSNNAFGGLGGTMGGRVSLEMARQRNISGAYTHASDEEEGHAAPSHSQAGSHREPHRSPLAAAAGGSSGLAPRVDHRVSAHTNVVLSAAYGAERHPATHTVGLA